MFAATLTLDLEAKPLETEDKRYQSRGDSTEVYQWALEEEL